jgi:predicted metal-binding membrane protein
VAFARDRTGLITGGLLLVVALAAWLALLNQGEMPTSVPGLAEAGAFVGAWSVMMAAMMLPSATPMLALYAVLRRNASDSQRGVPAAVFALVYLAVWAAFGVPVYLASLIISAQTWLTDLLPYAIAVALVGAGLYQLTPLKRACLRVCRNPLSFLLARSRAGYRGSLSLAFEHAMYCVGCCWALMVVLVAVGAMALNWVLLIAVVVSVEKLLPQGGWSAAIAGAGLVILGLSVAANPALVMMLRPPHMGM